MVRSEEGERIEREYEAYFGNEEWREAWEQAERDWKEVIKYIEEIDPALFTTRFTSGTQVRIAGHLYDWYIKNEKMIQGKYVQQMLIQTIIANKFNSKSLKRSIIEAWTLDI